MEPENTPLEEENHLPNHHFQVLCQSSGVYFFAYKLRPISDFIGPNVHCNDQRAGAPHRFTGSADQHSKQQLSPIEHFGPLCRRDQLYESGCWALQRAGRSTLPTSWAMVYFPPGTRPARPCLDRGGRVENCLHNFLTNFHVSAAPWGFTGEAVGTVVVAVVGYDRRWKPSLITCALPKALWFSCQRFSYSLSQWTLKKKFELYFPY